MAEMLAEDLRKSGTVSKEQVSKAVKQLTDKPKPAPEKAGRASNTELVEADAEPKIIRDN